MNYRGYRLLERLTPSNNKEVEVWYGNDLVEVVGSFDTAKTHIDEWLNAK